MAMGGDDGFFSGAKQWVQNNKADLQFGFQAAGAISSAGASIANAYAGYENTRLNSVMARIGADMDIAQAGRMDRDAVQFAKYAGDIQTSGEEQAANRLLRLRQDIGHIYSGAAGGNIEVGSHSVRGVASAARLMAHRAVSAINRSTVQAAQRSMDQARNAHLAWTRAATNAQMQKIQAHYQRKVGKAQHTASVINAGIGLGASLGFAAVGAYGGE